MLGKTPKTTGEMDAIHIPIVSTTCDDWVSNGEYVRFVDESLTKVESVESSFAHAIVDPLNHELMGKDTPFYVMILPGKSTPVRHHFDVIIEESPQENELRQAREKDPDCAKCWVIEDGQIIRY